MTIEDIVLFETCPYKVYNKCRMVFKVIQSSQICFYRSHVTLIERVVAVLLKVGVVQFIEVCIAFFAYCTCTIMLLVYM